MALATAVTEAPQHTLNLLYNMITAAGAMAIAAAAARAPQLHTVELRGNNVGEAAAMAVAEALSAR